MDVIRVRQSVGLSVVVLGEDNHLLDPERLVLRGIQVLGVRNLYGPLLSRDDGLDPVNRYV